MSKRPHSAAPFDPECRSFLSFFVFPPDVQPPHPGRPAKTITHPMRRSGSTKVQCIASSLGSDFECPAQLRFPGGVGIVFDLPWLCPVSARRCGFYAANHSGRSVAFGD
jgi:hypothetical protein